MAVDFPDPGRVELREGVPITCLSAVLLATARTGLARAISFSHTHSYSSYPRGHVARSGWGLVIGFVVFLLLPLCPSACVLRRELSSPAFFLLFVLGWQVGGFLVRCRRIFCCCLFINE